MSLRIALTALALALVAFVALTPGASASTQSELGDVDCDGTVTSRDAVLLLQRSAGLLQIVPCEKSDDVDENGATNANDAAFVLQYVAGLIPVLPPPAIALASIPTHCPEQAQLTDGAIMATDILTRNTDSLVLPRGLRITMGQELDGVLARIRELQPAVADIEPRTLYELGAVSITADGALSDTLRLLLAGDPPSVPLATGLDAFDTLNVRLRLQGIEATATSPQVNVTLCFPLHLNVYASADAFADAQGISAAHPEFSAGDASDIDAMREGDTWFVVVRDAAGDCPSGCTEESFSYFADNGEVTVQIDESEALQSERFVLLRCYTRGLPNCG